MNYAQYLAKRIKRETDVVFGVTGGCIVNVVDAFHKEGLKVVTMHHEQAAAMAADAYARVSGKLGVCFATSGPGGNNLLTGLACSYYDSIPVLAIVGQVPSWQLKECGVRQNGFQECPNSVLADSITKYSVRLEDDDKLEDCLEQAISDALHNRPGPTLLEICDDIQRCESSMDGYVLTYGYIGGRHYDIDMKELSLAIKGSKKPLVILGAGVKQGNCELLVRSFVENNQIPTFLTWGALDLLDDSDHYNMRDFGVTSQRIGNFAIQHADVILAIGTRLDSHTFHKPVSGQRVFMADIDKHEISNKDYVNGVNCSAETVLNYRFCHDKDISNNWRDRIALLRKKYPTVPAEDDPKNPYSEINFLAKHAEPNAIIIADAGQTVTWTMQAWKVKRGQLLFSAFNHSPMGYALPAAIGASFAAPNRPVYCITGDGGLMMNIQEIATIVGYELNNILVHVMHNGGYGMIRQTQSDWDGLEDDVACSPYIPPLSRIHEFSNLELNLTFSKLDKNSKIEPKLKAGDEFWNQKPYLTKEQVRNIREVLA